MKKTITTLALATAVLTACNNSSDNKGDSAQRTETQEVVETDYSVCDRGIRSQSIDGRWSRDSRVGDLKLNLIMELRNGAVQMTNTCSLRSRSLRVSASTSARYDDKTIEFLGSDQDSDSINEANLKMNCSVELKPLKLNYKLRGQCLVLTADGNPQEVVMVPAL